MTSHVQRKGETREEYLKRRNNDAQAKEYRKQNRERIHLVYLAMWADGDRRQRMLEQQDVYRYWNREKIAARKARYYRGE